MPETGARGEAGSGDGEAGIEVLEPMAGTGIARGEKKLELDTGLGENAGGKGSVELVPGIAAAILVIQHKAASHVNDVKNTPHRNAIPQQMPE